MTPKQEKALALNRQTGDAHYNCAQAVACVFEEETGLDHETLRKLGAGFGLGMGTMNATCGALCGAQMVLGLVKFSDKPIRATAAEVYSEFVNRCGASVCRDIKGIDTGKMLCSCPECVRNAVEILEGKLS